MRKAWEGGSGGSDRLLQCLVNGDEACIAYNHGWMRKYVQHIIFRSAAISGIILHAHVRTAAGGQCIDTWHNAIMPTCVDKAELIHAGFRG